MGNKALVFLEAAKLHFEKFRTFFYEAGYEDDSILIPEAEEKIFWLSSYIDFSIQKLSGGRKDERND